MSGIINTKNTGIYLFIEPIIINVIGINIALQQVADMQPNVTFENDQVDTYSTIHPVTISIPGNPGAITGTSFMLAKPVTGASDIFSINNSGVCNSGTLKFQNLGNCPISPMISSSSHKAHFNISQ